jgi:hypothetical protein
MPDVRDPMPTPFVHHHVITPRIVGTPELIQMGTERISTGKSAWRKFRRIGTGKRPSRRTSSLVLILVTLVITFLAIGASAQDNDRDKHNPVVGSWNVTGSFDDGRPAVQALYTFNSDRTFTMGGSWPGLFGPGHGACGRNEDNDKSDIELTFFGLLYTPTETSEATGTLNATFNGTLKVQVTLTVNDDGSGFTGRYLLTNYDSQGNVRSTTTGGLNAPRIVAEL